MTCFLSCDYISYRHKRLRMLCGSIFITGSPQVLHVRFPSDVESNNRPAASSEGKSKEMLFRVGYSPTPLPPSPLVSQNRGLPPLHLSLSIPTRWMMVGSRVVCRDDNPLGWVGNTWNEFGDTWNEFGKGLSTLLRGGVDVDNLEKLSLLRSKISKFRGQPPKCKPRTGL